MGWSVKNLIPSFDQVHHCVIHLSKRNASNIQTCNQQHLTCKQQSNSCITKCTLDRDQMYNQNNHLLDCPRVLTNHSLSDWHLRLMTNNVYPLKPKTFHPLEPVSKFNIITLIRRVPLNKSFLTVTPQCFEFIVHCGTH